MQRFAVFDIDGTLIRWQLYHAIADTLVRLGHGDANNFQTVKDARMNWKNRMHAESFKEYEHRLVKAVDQMLLHLSIEQFNEAANAVFEEYKDQVYTYTRGLLRELKNAGYLLFAISGSQEEIVEKIAKYHGFDDFVGSTYIKKGKSFTGEKILRAIDKHLVLAELIKKHGVTNKNSVAVGDSAGDISMLESVEQPIAFNPERKLFDHAVKQGWKVVVERKNMVFELESKDGTYVLAKTN